MDNGKYPHGHAYLVNNQSYLKAITQWVIGHTDFWAALMTLEHVS